MVSLADILLNNTSLLTPGSGPVCALVGCTDGIGLTTLHALLRHTSSPTIYLVGPGGSRPTSTGTGLVLETLIASVQGLNASATLIPIVAEDMTLVSCAQEAARQIMASTPPPSRLDLLIMAASPGTGYSSLSLSLSLPFSLSLSPSHPLATSMSVSAMGTSLDFSPEEGLDRVTCMRYHARMRLVLTLLPLLRAAASPRVLSVFAGGREGTLHDMHDLGMTRPGPRYGSLYAAGAAAAMTTLFFERLATQPGNDKIVFLHIYPGIVFGDDGGGGKGGTATKDLEVQKSRYTASLLAFLCDWILTPVLKLAGWSIPCAEAGERVLFAATNGRFRRVQDPERAKGTLIQQGSDGVLGSGVYLVNPDSSVVEGGGNTELKRLRSEVGAGQKVWEYTMGELERIERLSGNGKP